MPRNPLGSDSVTVSGAHLMHRLSQLLLSLYQLPHTVHVGEFDLQMLHLLREHIEFDGAWFGHSSITPDSSQFYNSCLYNMRPDFMRSWEKVKRLDPLLRLARSAPDEVSVWETSQVPLCLTIQRFCQEQEIEQVLFACTNQVHQRVTHLSLFRREHRPFNHSDASVLQMAMLHIAAAQEQNRLHWTREDRVSCERGASALFAQGGELLFAEDSFIRLVEREWPFWEGQILPEPLQLSLSQRVLAGPFFTGGCIQMYSQPLGLYCLVRARAVGGIAILSPRELAVARLYGDGCTYKEVAKRLGIAPATARHHLRRVYLKLRVSSKSGLIHVLRDDPALAEEGQF